MGMAAIGQPELAGKVAEATAYELGCVGVNLIYGPVLDVLSTSRPSPLGVRAFSDDPVTVLTHGLDMIRGFNRASMLSCGKHFPSYGDVEFPDGTEFSLPSVVASADDLRKRAFVPFRACAQAGMDAILVGGCSMEIDGRKVSHACLDHDLVSNILRRECSFEGCIISDCLAMEALCHEIGTSQGVSRAIRAGCDMVTVCQSYQAQLEALISLKLAVHDGSISRQSLTDSNRRINKMKDRYTSWERALHPPGVAGLASRRLEHQTLSSRAFEGALSLIRDRSNGLDALTKLPKDAQILLLTPVVGLFPSIATRETPTQPDERPKAALAPGEETFQSFGAALAKSLKARLVHTSYSANGLRPLHEDLIERSSAVIVLTTDATRNSYQYAVTKHSNMQCKYQLGDNGQRKPCVVAALSYPHDFLADHSIETYICAYDFTEPSLRNLVRLLTGKLHTTTMPPLAAARRALNHPTDREQSRKTMWLVEAFNVDRDTAGLQKLLEITSRSQLLPQVREETCFVVRNSSMKTLLGLVVMSMQTSSAGHTDQIEAIVVDPGREGLGIEESLREHAVAVKHSASEARG
ncbi:hypothetical protein PRZ48_001528 [Zasmidium cellare]|uniref:Glycoside hydrolase family 3 N-terminal domain-containing protein n=1 Tax=Zasmidium cellare TaxID=395010 RepID=A0ABR0F3E0_ZASCE|nr:hypothetical protein PRZ48_001528 [Zasmidium cellare]